MVLPEGLEELGNGAFNSNRLTEIVFPSTLTNPHYNVFANAAEATEHNLVTRVEFKTKAFVPNDDLVDWFESFISFNYILSVNSYLNDSPMFVIELVFSTNDVDGRFMEQAFWEAHDAILLDSNYQSVFTFETVFGSVRKADASHINPVCELTQSSIRRVPNDIQEDLSIMTGPFFGQSPRLGDYVIDIMKDSFERYHTVLVFS